jgi:hypothetical protein
MGLTKEEKADLKEDNETIDLEIKIELLRKELAEEMRAKAEQKRINKEAKKRDAEAGMNRGGMGKAKTGHTDYRKGGMVYGSKK